MQQVGDYDYDLRDKLGQGAFAIVYKGRLRKDPKWEIAVKCIEKKKIPKPQALLSKEIRILKELSSLKHENVVRLLDCKESADTLFLITEYCNGGDLADYLREKRTLSEDTIARFVTQIAGAMEALYTKGIVHRDIKPHNLLLAYPSKNAKPSEIKIKIADFGFARFLEAGVMAATLCGSPMYMAPEVLMSHRYDAKADLWSIGTIVYQCLTGHGPFHAETPHQLKTYYEKNPQLQPQIPTGTSSLLRDLICRLLKRNASDRIEFETFFQHPFVIKYAKRKASAPVAVPRRPSDAAAEETDSTGSTSSSLQAVSVSPLSTLREHTPPSVKHTAAAVGSPSLRKALKNTNASQLKKAGDNEPDYVMVPGNCPADHKAYVMDQARAGQSHQQSLSITPAAAVGAADRPLTLPVLGSAPLPVPMQRRAEHRQLSSDSPRSPGRFRHPSRTDSPRSRRSSESSSNVDVGSMTPPNMTFAVGTPPNSAGFKGQQTNRPRSNTDGSLRNMQQSPPQSQQPSSRPRSIGMAPSSSFSVERRGTFGSTGILAELNRRPSYAHGSPAAGDRSNNENFQFGGSYADLSSPLAAGGFPYAQSPPNMDGPVAFVVPELTEETLHSVEHRDTLSKLQFVSCLICSLLELAQTRTSPLLESRNANKLAGCVVFVSEKQRRIEQLVLYIRALHVLSSSLQLAKDEVASGKLQPSPAVKAIVKELNGFYHNCLSKCKLLKSKGVDTGGTDQQFLNNTADKLIYEHAIEQCQKAALDELFGNPIECVKRYRNAHTLLHSLAQMADLSHDQQLLNSYKQEVEKRLIYLEGQGYCIAIS